MPTVIDSLFLELGIDTSKFSSDQKKALEKISSFEAQSKRSAEKAAGAVKTVGKAFREIADDTAIGASARRLDTFSVKLRALGQASRVNGGAAGGLGMMAEGLGALLSPATMVLAAVGLLGKGMWDFDKKMTAANATIYRQSQLAGMNAKSLWTWAEAAKTVGANPQEISGGIAGLQTAVMGMGIGAGNATGQLVSLARLGGVGWNFRTGVNIPQLFERVHELAKARGYQNLGALRALTSPVMNDAMFALATSPKFSPRDITSQIKRMEPANFGKILAGAITSQERLGIMGAAKDTLMQRAYGATHSVFDAMAVGIQELVGLVTSIWDFISHPMKAVHDAEKFGRDILIGAQKGWRTGGVFGALGGGIQGYRGAVNNSIGRRMVPIVQALMAQGLSQPEAIAMAGNFMQESQLNPFARNGNHIGMGQWDRRRQAMFRQMFGYRMGSAGIPAGQQIRDQAAFAVWELHNTVYGRQTLAAMKSAKTIQDKTNAVNAYYERSGEVAYIKALRQYGVLGVQNLTPAFNRVAYAQDVAAILAAAQARPHVVHSTVTHHTQIGAVNVATQATDARAMADGARRHLSAHPLINPPSQHTVSLATRGAQ